LEHFTSPSLLSARSRCILIANIRSMFRRAGHVASTATTSSVLAAEAGPPPSSPVLPPLLALHPPPKVRLPIFRAIAPKYRQPAHNEGVAALEISPADTSDTYHRVSRRYFPAPTKRSRNIGKRY